MFPELSQFKSLRRAFRALNTAFAHVPVLAPLVLLIMLASSVIAFLIYVRFVQALRLSGELDFLFFFLFIGLGTILPVFFLLGGFIRRDLRAQLTREGRNICLECGYDLRGLPSSICPECGSDSSRSRVRYPLFSHVLIWTGLLISVLLVPGLLIGLRNRSLGVDQIPPLVFWTGIGISCGHWIYEQRANKTGQT